MSMYSLLAIPSINCLWSYFPNHAGKIIGLSAFVFGIATFGYTTYALNAINPNNIKATIEYSENSDILLFDTSISDRVPATLQNLAKTYFIFNLLGSILVSHKSEKKK